MSSPKTSAGEDLGWAKAEGAGMVGCPTATTFWSSRTEDNYSRYLVLRLMLTRYRYDVLRVIASGGSSPAASHRLPVAGNAA